MKSKFTPGLELLPFLEMESSSRSLSTCLLFSFPSPFLVKRPRNFAFIFWIPKAFLHSLEQNPVLGFQFHFPCCLIQAFSHCSKVKTYLRSCLKSAVLGVNVNGSFLQASKRGCMCIWGQRGMDSQWCHVLRPASPLHHCITHWPKPIALICLVCGPTDS